MILEFDYLKKFKCTSYDCINTCCSGWDIHVDEKTFSKIQNSKDPKIENFFLNKLKKSNNKNFAAEINTNKNKRCIFLYNKNLCKIQKNIDSNFQILNLLLQLTHLVLLQKNRKYSEIFL